MHQPVQRQPRLQVSVESKNRPRHGLVPLGGLVVRQPNKTPVSPSIGGAQGRVKEGSRKGAKTPRVIKNSCSVLVVLAALRLRARFSFLCIRIYYTAQDFALPVGLVNRPAVHGPLVLLDHLGPAV